jgi:acyl-CoA thioesterase FadM
MDKTFSRSLGQVPSLAYVYDAIVAESDVDHNQHTNQASYIRFCCDALGLVIRDGQYWTLAQAGTWHLLLSFGEHVFL